MGPPHPVWSKYSSASITRGKYAGIDVGTAKAAQKVPYSCDGRDLNTNTPPPFARFSNSCVVCRRLPAHHQYSKSQPLSVGIFFARSPSENALGVASVAPVAVRFQAKFPKKSLSVISRDASARDPTSSIFNDLWAAGSRSNLVGRRGIGKKLARSSFDELGRGVEKIARCKFARCTMFLHNPHLLPPRIPSEP